MREKQRRVVKLTKLLLSHYDELVYTIKIPIIFETDNECSIFRSKIVVSFLSLRLYHFSFIHSLIFFLYVTHNSPLYEIAILQ